jgi:hypothetical protein
VIGPVLLGIGSRHMADDGGRWLVGLPLYLCAALQAAGAIVAWRYLHSHPGLSAAQADGATDAERGMPPVESDLADAPTPAEATAFAASVAMVDPAVVSPTGFDPAAAADASTAAGRPAAPAASAASGAKS